MRKIMRLLHLWLSVPLGLIVMLTCLSGAILVFEPEITQLVRRSIYFTTVQREYPLPLSDLLDEAERKLLPGERITGVVTYANPKRSYRIIVAGTEKKSLFVDPYTAQLSESVPERLPFFSFIYDLHRNLLLKEKGGGIGPLGKTIVGISTFCLVLILLSGLVLWWPKKRKALPSRLKVRVHKGWIPFWYSLHIAGGFWATSLLILMALTGLTWSSSVYRQAVYSLFGANEDSTEHNSKMKTRPVHISSYNTNISSLREEPLPRYLAWERALEYVRTANPSGREYVLSAKSVAVKCSGWGNGNASDRYLFDKKTGHVQEVRYYSEATRSQKLGGWIQALHTGKWAGLLGRVLAFLAALLGASLPITGYLMWYRRLKQRTRQKNKKKVIEHKKDRSSESNQ